MKKIAFSALAFIATASTALSADLPARTMAPAPAPAYVDDLIFGSVTAGIKAFWVPDQYDTQSMFAPLATLGGKFTYQLPDRSVGFQLDANFAGSSTDVMNPNARNTVYVYSYGAAAHLFTRAITDAKLGVFVSADWLGGRAASGNGSLLFPMFRGGVEGQYAYTPNLLLRAHIGLGQVSVTDRTDKLKATEVFGGVGVTYALNEAWRIGADINLNNAYHLKDNTGGSANLSAGLMDLSGFAEYRLANLPLTLRGELGWLKPISFDDTLNSKTTRYNALHTKLSLRYEFGGNPARQRPLVDSEFTTQQFLMGSR